MIKRIAGFLLVITLCGCGTTSKFVYPSNQKELVKLSDSPKYDCAVAVLPFEEMRKDDNTIGTLFLYYIPLVPYGYVTYDRPDAARSFVSVNEFDFNVTDDLARASVTSLRRSGLFKDVFFTYGGERDKSELTLTGEVYSTMYKGRVFSYGLSIVAPIFWLLGVPYGTSTDELIFKLCLKRNSDGKILWEYSYSGSEYIVQGLYYNMGRDVRNYVILMETAMNEAAKDIDKSLQKNGDRK
ncbi:MAG: hypothetical protein A2020_11565 [Lentisphaerae bacterium GWF2_45_14]|nr:MAG: hypothetical protein A2020_11565 [Lentisphaerae bacterium GWF2_45_14]